MKTNNHLTLVTVLLLCLLISGFANGQNYQFNPDWKVGETKTLIKHQVYKKFEQGELVQEDEQTLEKPQVIEVLKSNPEYLEVVMNTDVDEFQEYFSLLERMNPEVDFPRQIQVVYKISKETAEIEVVNLAEILNNYQKYFEPIQKMFDEISAETPMFVSIFANAFDILISSLTSETALQARLIDKIEPLIIPFKTIHQPGEVKVTEEEMDNPLDPKQKIRCTVSTTFDSSSGNQHIFQYSINYDIDQEEFKQAFIDMMITTIKSFAAAFVAEDEIDMMVEKQIEPMREAEFSYHIQQTIVYDNQSNWVNKIITTYRTKMLDPQTIIPYETEMIETITVQ